MEKLVLTPNCTISRKDGTLVSGDLYNMATEEQIAAFPGDRVRLLDNNYVFEVALYFPRILKRLIYRYGYSKEGNWTIYTRNITDDSFSDMDFVIRKERYFRVVVARRDGRAITSEDISKAKNIVAFEPYEENRPKNVVKPWFRREIDIKSRQVNAAIAGIKNPFSLVLLADSHYTVNGTWDDTATNISEMAALVNYDGIVHLGDLTDGMTSKRLTAKYVRRIINDLKSTGKDVYITIGNHDSNYFKNMDRALSTDEKRCIYDLPVAADAKTLDYYVDYKDKKLRLIFVESFDHTRFFKYGYSDAQIEWLKKAFATAPRDTRFMIFTHDTPCEKHDVTCLHTSNGARFINVLRHYNGLNGFKIIGLFYGHTHADFEYYAYGFPMISVNSCKLEFFNELKPRGAVRWYKQARTVTQDSWDNLIVDLDTGKLLLIRFGAGKDRVIEV